MGSREQSPEPAQPLVPPSSIPSPPAQCGDRAGDRGHILNPHPNPTDTPGQIHLVFPRNFGLRRQSLVRFGRAFRAPWARRGLTSHAFPRDPRSGRWKGFHPKHDFSPLLIPLVFQRAQSTLDRLHQSPWALLCLTKNSRADPTLPAFPFMAGIKSSMILGQNPPPHPSMHMQQLPAAQGGEAMGPSPEQRQIWN